MGDIMKKGSVEKNSTKKNSTKKNSTNRELKRLNKYVENVKCSAATGCVAGMCLGGPGRAALGACAGAFGAVAAEAVLGPDDHQDQVERTKAEKFVDSTKCGAATGCAAGMCLGGLGIAALGGCGGAGAGMWCGLEQEKAAEEKAYTMTESEKDDKFYKEFWAKRGGVR